MPHTDEEIQAAEATLAARLESGGTFDMQETPDLRAVADAAAAVEAATALLRERVQVARAHGHSWNRIAIPLGVSRQAARQRFSGEGEGAQASGGPATDLMAALEQNLAEIQQTDATRESSEKMPSPPATRSRDY